MAADTQLGASTQATLTRSSWLLLSVALAGCISVDHATKSTGGSGARSGTGGASGTAGSGAASGGKASGTGGASSGGTGGKPGTGGKAGSGGRAGTGGAGGAAGGGTDSGLPPPTNTTPEADPIDAHVTGRNGDDLTFTVSGADAEGDVLFLSVDFQDAGGAPVKVFDTHWDGVADSSSDRLLFDTSLLGQPRFFGTVTLVGFAASWPDATSVVVHLEDMAGNLSTDQSLSIGQQEVRKAGEACDPLIVADRCDPGLSCTGDPALCQAGVAPDITDIGYFRVAEGPRLLVAGTDPDDDLTSLHLEFLSAAGSPVLVDLNGDQVPDSSSFDVAVDGASKQGTFFAMDQLGLGFDATSPNLAVTPIDGAANSGKRKTVKIGAPPVRSLGQACDARGLDACQPADVCAPGTVDAKSQCSGISTWRKSLCAGAPVIDTSTATLSAYGRAVGTGVWDPPTGCAPPFALERPEGIVRLHLASDAAQVTITTALPETRFDTVLYVLASCDSDATPTTACSDDDRGTASTVSLTAAKAGDYIIVVDSAHATGGSFGVSVSVK